MTKVGYGHEEGFDLCLSCASKQFVSRNNDDDEANIDLNVETDDSNESETSLYSYYEDTDDYQDLDNWYEEDDECETDEEEDESKLDVDNPEIFLEIYHSNHSLIHECPNLSFKIDPNIYYQEKVNEGRKGQSANVLKSSYPPCLCCGNRFNTNMSKPWQCTFRKTRRCQESKGYGHYGVFMPNMPQEKMICFYCHFYVFCEKNNKLQTKSEFYLIGCKDFKIDSQSDKIKKLQNKVSVMEQYIHHLESVVVDPSKLPSLLSKCIQYDAISVKFYISMYL